MQLLIFFIICVLIIGLLFLYRFLDQRRVKAMTKERLIEKCKKLIDEGNFDRVHSTLMHHPMLLLKHFDELKTVLSDYACGLESRLSEIKKEV